MTRLLGWLIHRWRRWRYPVNHDPIMAAWFASYTWDADAQTYRVSDTATTAAYRATPDEAPYRRMLSADDLEFILDNADRESRTSDAGEIV